MAVPKQVQDRGDAADKMLKEQVEGSGGKTKEDEDLKLVPAPTDDKGVQAGEEPIPDKEKPIDQDPPKEPENFEQKYKVLKGKYDKEVNADVEALQESAKAAEQSNLELKAQVTELSRLLSLLQEKKTDPPKPKPKPEGPIEAKSFLSAEEIEQFEDAGYDEKDLNVLAVLAQRISEKSVSPLAANVQKIAQTTANSKEDRFWEGLDRSVKEWKALQKEPGFLEFMGSKAPYLNATRQKVLEAAAKRLDLDTVVEIYNDYLKTRKTPSAPPPKPKLGKQVEPGGGAGGELPAEGKIYTRAEVKKFYDDQVKGVYRMNPDEAKRIDDDILLAQVQGRIKP